jgi:hypothetical protein
MIKLRQLSASRVQYCTSGRYGNLCKKFLWNCTVGIQALWASKHSTCFSSNEYCNHWTQHYIQGYSYVDWWQYSFVFNNATGMCCLKVMFLFFVHWVCIKEKIRSAFASWGGMTKKICENLNNSEWRSPFREFSKYWGDFLWMFSGD